MSIQLPFQIRDRVKEFKRVPASSLIPNPKNWRLHPEEQSAALRGMLEEVGFAGAMLVYETPAGYMLIDGHLRTETMGEQPVPILVTDLTEEEADQILATYDPLGAMASADTEALTALIGSVKPKLPNVQLLLDKIGEGHGLDRGDINFDATKVEGVVERGESTDAYVLYISFPTLDMLAECVRLFTGGKRGVKTRADSRTMSLDGVVWLPVWKGETPPPAEDPKAPAQPDVVEA